MGYEASRYSIEIFKTANGKIPFKKWLESFSEIKTQTTIRIRLDRLSLGNLNQCKSLGNGLYELKIDIGPGYRIYFGNSGQMLILLLCGGDKQSQPRDIEKARAYWKDYKIRGQKS